MVKEPERTRNRALKANAQRPFRRALRWFQERDNLFRDLTNLIIAVATVYVAIQANTIAKNQSALMETQNTLLQLEQLPLFDLSLVEQEGDSSTGLFIYNTRGVVSQVQLTTTVAIPVCLSAPDPATPAAPSDPVLADLDTCQMLVLTDVFGPTTYDRSDSGEIAHAIATTPLANLQTDIATARTELANHPLESGDTLTLLDAVVVVDLSYVDAAGRLQATSFQLATDGSERIVEMPVRTDDSDPLASATSLSTDIGVTTDSAGNPRHYVRHRMTTSEFTAEAIRNWWSSEIPQLAR